MADFLRKMFDKIKIWIAWLWTYLWALWFLLVVFVVYILRGPLRIGENFTSGLLQLLAFPIETARVQMLNCESVVKSAYVCRFVGEYRPWVTVATLTATPDHLELDKKTKICALLHWISEQRDAD